MQLNLKPSKTLSGSVAGNSENIKTLANPVYYRLQSVEASANEVVFHYPGYDVTYRADGSGTTRSNVTCTVTLQGGD